MMNGLIDKLVCENSDPASPRRRTSHEVDGMVRVKSGPYFVAFARGHDESHGDFKKMTRMPRVRSAYCLARAIYLRFVVFDVFAADVDDHAADPAVELNGRS